MIQSFWRATRRTTGSPSLAPAKLSGPEFCMREACCGMVRLLSTSLRPLSRRFTDQFVSHHMPKSIVMKMIPFTSMAALLLPPGAGCTSIHSSGNDEAKVVARILARTAPPMLTFQNRAGAQQLVSSLDTSEYTGGCLPSPTFAFGVSRSAPMHRCVLFADDRDIYDALDRFTKYDHESPKPDSKWDSTASPFFRAVASWSDEPSLGCQEIGD